MHGLFGSAAAWCVAGSLDGSNKIGRWRPFGTLMRKRVCAQARRISPPTVLGLTSIPLGTQALRFHSVPLRSAARRVATAFRHDLQNRPDLC
jgi:hypothetical protein